MFRRGLFAAVAAAALLSCGAAVAGTELEFAPPGAWVSAVDTPAPPAKPDPAPIRVLLFDMQVRYGVDADEIYSRRVIQVLTPQGLAIGNLAQTWSPDRETLVIHHVHIIRNGQVIDVLKNGGEFTILRRENSLEMAKLDGKLTAAMQPEGLEVGDILDIALTSRRLDPTMGGHSELVTALIGGIKIGRLHLREVWPAAKPVRWRVTEGLPKPTVRKLPGGDTELTLDLTDSEAPKPPARAPKRYTFGLSQLEATDFQSWGEIAATMSPLWTKAVTLKTDSAVHAEAAKIAAQTSDPVQRANAAVRLVQEKIRYVYLGMNLGGYTPADADATWARRYGDCKGKTALLVALLRDLGIEAEPAFVSTVYGDGMDQRLPMIELFDHAIVRATINGKVYWLDGTRLTDRNIDLIETPAFGWALPVRAAGSTLEKLELRPSSRPTSEFLVRIDASAGLDFPAPTRVEWVQRGPMAQFYRDQFATLPPEEVDKTVREYMEIYFDFVEPHKVSASFDESTGEERFVMDGTAGMAWASKLSGGARRYEADLAEVGEAEKIKRDDGPYKDAPYAIEFPSWEHVSETIILPQGGAGFTVTGPDVDKVVGGRSFKRAAKIENGVFTMVRDTRSLAPEFPAADVVAVQKALGDLANQAVYVEAPKSYEPGPAETKAALAFKPETAPEFVSRAAVLLDAGQYDAAMADFAAAVKLKPDRADTWNGRCWARGKANRALEDALSDCNEALRLSPDSAAYLDSRGLVYLRMGKLDEAIRDYDEALRISPQQTASLYVRGIAKRRKGLIAEGDADIAAARQASPDIAEEFDKYGIKP